MNMPFQEKFCPLCDQAAAIVFLTHQDSYHIDCQCCGTFNIARTLWHMLDVSHSTEDDQRPRRYLSCYTRQTSESGTPVELDTHNWRACAQRHMSTPITQKI